MWGGPPTAPSYAELSNFFGAHDGVDSLERGLLEIDPDREDLDRMLLIESMRREAMQP